jgi:hypothetical protein
MKYLTEIIGLIYKLRIYQMYDIYVLVIHGYNKLITVKQRLC